jgi:hypothetical protein
MNKLFSFDVRLKDLMNLGERAKEVKKLDLIFMLLKGSWYTLKNDPNAEQERWDRIRVGSVDVYLDEGKNLHLDFVTRFHFENSPEILALLDELKNSNW